jgi:hypothetical protein
MYLDIECFSTVCSLFRSSRKARVTEHRQQISDLSRFRKNLEQWYGEGGDKLRILVTIARECGQENYQRKFATGRGSPILPNAGLA